MKLNFASVALALALPTMALAQKQNEVYPNTFSSGSANVSKFTNKSKRFNDWAISAGVGLPFMQSADLTSIKNGNGKNLYGYSTYISVDKAINHVFGLKLQYDMGQTKQGWIDIDRDAYVSGSGGAKTKYHAISVLGDVNFTNIFRRIDNNSPYRWALHGYVGAGTLAYKTHHKGKDGVQLMTDQPFQLGSIFTQFGTGVKYKVSRRVDIEGRLMYLMSGDDEFDGGGEPDNYLNKIEENVSDNLINLSLGVTFKLGKHQSHLFWHDPLQELNYKISQLSVTPDIEVCKKGDGDNDGVCDDWDRQLDTPAGARVDGAGVALDTDLDGVIDLNDKCVTVPGPASNQGCPEQPKAVVAPVQVDMSTEIERALKDILFVFNKTEIRAESYDKLDLAADIIKSSGGGTYLLVGHTDKKGNDLYNLNLSKGRARAVMLELEKRGVNPSQLKSIGVGEQMAVIPETASDEERLSDRKVTVRFVTGNEWSSLRKSDAEPARKAPAKKVVRKRK